MFVKLLVGVFATAVLGAGSFAYYHHVVDGSHCCPLQQLASGDEPASPCCRLASPSLCSDDDNNCCKDVEPEPLTIEPREVK